MERGWRRLTSSSGRRTAWRYLVLTLPFFALVGAPEQARAACTSLKSGAIVYDVTGCGALVPEKHFDLTKEKYAWIADLDASGRKKFFDTYRGLFVKGVVVKSQAVNKGLSEETGVLMGETVWMFIPPNGMSCGSVNGMRLSGELKEMCCDGAGDPPCLLGTSYLLTAAQSLGAASSAAGDQSRERSKQSKDYAQGVAAYKAQKWKDAAKAFERARNNGELDIRGHYMMGHSLRELDQCGDAVSPLKKVHEAREKKQIWADEEAVARQASFLLARCYSKLNDPSSAVMILNSYLLEPQKYKRELKDSLAHKDFGWIHTSKEYRDYERAAKKKLK